MKNSAAQIIVFVILLLAFTLAAAFVYYIYIGCMGLQAGEAAVFPSVTVYLYGLALTFPYCAVTALLFVFFFLIRHPSNPFFSALFWTLLAAFVWLVCLPVSFKLKTEFPKPPRPAVITVPTARFFRQSGTSLYYWTQTFPDSTGPGAEIIPSLPANNMRFYDKLLFNENTNMLYTSNKVPLPSLGGEDNLIRRQVSPPAFIEPIVSTAVHLMTQLESAWNNGWLAYLLCASAGIGIAAIWPFGWITGWRLLNLTLIITAFWSIILINANMFTSSIMLHIAAAFGLTTKTNMSFYPLIVNGVLFAGLSIIGLILREIRTVRVNRPKRKHV